MKPVCRMKADVLTRPTAEAIYANNVTGKALCGGKWAQCAKVEPVAPAAPAPAAPAAKPVAAGDWPWRVVPSKGEVEPARAKRTAALE